MATKATDDIRILRITLGVPLGMAECDQDDEYRKGVPTHNQQRPFVGCARRPYPDGCYRCCNESSVQGVHGRVRIKARLNGCGSAGIARPIKICGGGQRERAKCGYAGSVSPAALRLDLPLCFGRGERPRSASTPSPETPHEHRNSLSTRRGGFRARVTWRLHRQPGRCRRPTHRATRWRTSQPARRTP